MNTGRALYQGVEGETTYAFGDDDFGGALDGLSAFASASYNSTRSNHLDIKSAPLWTNATGLVYKIDAFKLSLIDKLVVICGMHFRSDTIAGQQFGTIMAIRLMQNPQFQADMAAARAELVAAHLAP